MSSSFTNGKSKRKDEFQTLTRAVSDEEAPYWSIHIAYYIWKPINKTPDIMGGLSFLDSASGYLWSHLPIFTNVVASEFWGHLC